MIEYARGLGRILSILGMSACTNQPASPDDDVGEIAQHDLEKLPSALTRLDYSTLPDYAVHTDDTCYELLDAPRWMKIDPATGQLHGTPQLHDAHAHQKVRIASCTGDVKRIWNTSIRTALDVKYRNTGGYDAYAFTYQGETRKLRDDLRGELAAEIQFLQSHASAPAQNHVVHADDQTQSRYMPSITANREALLLFLPHQVDATHTVHVILRQHDNIVATLAMTHPNDLPHADNPTAWDVRYSARAWSLRVPYEWMNESLSAEFVVNQGAPDEQRGELLSKDLEISPASSLIFRSLRLGMLTHVDQSAGHYTLDAPILAATDYFQTLPVSRLVMASYADVELDRVMVQDGTIYDLLEDGASASSGDIYSGDMRESVAKAQVSTGINLANIGVSSNNMRQQYSHGFKQITNHHAWGIYTNTVENVPTQQRVAHGLSGGNGIGTLVDSRGNEASHEWGHAYGLGHYPGQTLTEDGRWAEHHADSGWGLILHRNRLRHGITGVYNGSLTYNSDAMSGGFAASPFSVYTYYTGFSARIIQQDIAQFLVPSATSSTGYLRWSAEGAKYLPYEGELRRPDAVGVPVATLLGGY